MHREPYSRLGNIGVYDDVTAHSQQQQQQQARDRLSGEVLLADVQGCDVDCRGENDRTTLIGIVSQPLGP